VTRSINGEKVETGTYFLTFQLTSVPERIFCGYERIKVTPYVDEPMRCFKCLKFGHQKLRCRFEDVPICGRCAKPQHIDKEKQEKCTDNSYCVNCESNDHGSFDKRCAVYKKEYEIAKIKVYEKVNFGEAQRLYTQRQFQGGRTMAGIVRDAVDIRQTKTCGCPCICKRQPEKKTNDQAGSSGEAAKNQKLKEAATENNNIKNVKTVRREVFELIPGNSNSRVSLASTGESDVEMEEDESGDFRVSLNMSPEEEELLRTKIDEELETEEEEKDDEGMKDQIDGIVEGGSEGKKSKKKKKVKRKKSGERGSTEEKETTATKLMRRSKKDDTYKYPK
jgi:hypothetical protein